MQHPVCMISCRRMTDLEVSVSGKIRREIVEGQAQPHDKPWIVRFSGGMAHWKRSTELVQEDREHSGKVMARFVRRLEELVSFLYDTGDHERPNVASQQPVLASEVFLSVSEVARDVRTGETFAFTLDRAGSSPHMAIMGGVGSGGNPNRHSHSEGLASGWRHSRIRSEARMQKIVAWEVPPND